MKNEKKPFWETKINPIVGYKLSRINEATKTDRDLKKKYNERYRNRNKNQ